MMVGFSTPQPHGRTLLLNTFPVNSCRALDPPRVRARVELQHTASQLSSIDVPEAKAAETPPSVFPQTWRSVCGSRAVDVQLWFWSSVAEQREAPAAAAQALSV